MTNLQTYYHFKLDFQKVDQHTGSNDNPWHQTHPILQWDFRLVSDFLFVFHVTI